MAKGKSKKSKGTFKKCKSCSLDCTVTRAIAVDSAKKEAGKSDIIKRLYGDGKPKYSRETCPKE